MKTALFLGAGASKFVKYPATEELMGEVRERVRKRASELHRDSSCQNYITSVVEDETYSDVEKLYDGIVQIINTSKNPNCGPIISNTHYQNGITYEQINKELDDLLSIIDKILLDSFDSRSDVPGSIVPM